MKISMNEFRRSFHHDVCTLREIAAQIVAGERYDKKCFVEAVDEVIRVSNVLNCIYNQDDPDFVEMGNLECPFLSDENPTSLYLG